jgi:hypothetical protein
MARRLCNRFFLHGSKLPFNGVVNLAEKMQYNARVQQSAVKVKSYLRHPNDTIPYFPESAFASLLLYVSNYYFFVHFVAKAQEMLVDVLKKIINQLTMSCQCYRISITIGCQSRGWTYQVTLLTRSRLYMFEIEESSLSH